jgi:FlaA1/EpsC-like NDP-sugar epimerase
MMAIRAVSERDGRRGARILPASVRSVLLLVFDALAASVSFWLAMLLRFEGHIRPAYLAVLPTLVVMLVVARLASGLLFKLHRWSFRFSGLTDGMRVGLAGLLGTGLFMSGVYFLATQGPPRSVVVMEFFLTTTAMGLVRFSPRLGWMYRADRRRIRRNGTLRTLIVGAGVAGDMLRRDLAQSDEHNYRVVGFVDDDRSKWGAIIGGIPVLGGIADVPRLVQEHEIGKVLIAIPRLEGARVREILGLCADLKVRFKILPVSFVYLRDRTSASMLQDLAPEDLLPREQVTFPDRGEPSPFLGHRALVTGAAGSIGSEICAQLTRGGIGSLLMVDINENGLYLLKRRFDREQPSVPVVAEIADIRDKHRMRALLEAHRPHDVFHAAAHKHVPLMEAAPCEAIKNNVVATREIAIASDACGVDRFVYISTDKAVRPTSVMGASKRVGEMIVRALAARSKTRFCAVRFGNVLGSAGSVVPLFREQIAAGGPVTVTHRDVRRYFMTTGEAVALVLKAAYGDFGALCVLDMGEQIKIVDLAKHMITMAGLVPEADIPIAFTGLRPGEKLFEELVTEDEERTVRVSEKILGVTSPPPPGDLDLRVDELATAANAGDAARVVSLLRVVVPSYATPEGVSHAARPEPSSQLTGRVIGIGEMT